MKERFWNKETGSVYLETDDNSSLGPLKKKVDKYLDQSVVRVD